VHSTRELEALDLQTLTQSLGRFGQEEVDAESLGNVLELGFAQRHDRAQVQSLAYLLIDHLRDTDRVRLG